MVDSMEQDNLVIKLRRDFRFWDVVFIGVGAMTGATIYLMAGQTISIAGTGILLAILFNYIITMLTGMTYAELSTIYPEAGGGYLFIEETLPKPFGFMSGWMSWFSHSIADAFYTVVFATGIVWLLHIYGVSIPISPDLFKKLIIVALLAIILLINYWGTSTTGKWQTYLTTAQISILVIFIVAGFIGIIYHPNFKNLLPLNLNITNIALAMGLLFVGFEGYEIIAQSSEEIENPEKNIPRAIFMSIAIVTIIYALLFLVMLINSGPNILGEKGEFAVIWFGNQMIPYYGYGLMIMAMLIGSGATLNATVFSSIRVSFAMGRNGSLPKLFSHLHKKHNTPYIATLISGIIIGAMALFLPLDTIVAGASIMFLLLFTLVNIAVIVNRYQNPQLKRGYSIPLFPLVPILAIITNLFVAAVLWYFSSEAWFVAIAWIEVGLLIYYFWAGKKEIEKPSRIVSPTKLKIEKKEYNILVPLSQEFPNSVKIATLIARRMDANLHLFSAIEVPINISPQSITYSDSLDKIKMMERMEKVAKKYGKTPEVTITVAHDTFRAIIDEVNENGINILFMTWRPKNVRRIIFGSTLEKVYKNPPCDMLIFRNHLEENINKISLILSKRKSGEFSFQIASYLAKELNCSLIIYEFTYDGNISIKGDQYLKLSREMGIEAEIIPMKSNGIMGKIFNISKESKLLIMAPPSEYMDGRLPPSTEPRIIGRLNGPVLIVRKVITEKEQDLSGMYHG
ncbi:MAG: amino acid permease [Thermoplasmata archaeon]|nr:amino acid permease [Thermoplasmata archaeon]